MTRTPQEVFQHHGEAPKAEDLDGIVSDYSDDARSSPGRRSPQARRAPGIPATG